MLPRPRRSRPSRFAGAFALAGTLGVLFSAGAAHAQAQVSIVPTVTITGGLYNYSYTVTNFTDTSLGFVNLDTLPTVDGAITNLSAPTGFEISPFDSTDGIVTFLPGFGTDAQEFSPGSTISGFSFSSAFGPGAVSFDTQDVNGVNPINGTTIGPNAAVPEASTLVSLGAGLALLTFVAVRRRRSTATIHA